MTITIDYDNDCIRIGNGDENDKKFLLLMPRDQLRNAEEMFEFIFNNVETLDFDCLQRQVDGELKTIVDY